MDVHPFAYSSDAPIDPHTEALLATFGPQSVELPTHSSPQMVLRSWAAMASRSDHRLVIVDSRFRCERNAIANLLDDPTVTSAVLLAHSDAAGINSCVRVDADGFLTEDGFAVPTAGLLVVAPAQLAAFTDGLYRAAAAVASAGETVDPWDVAVAVLTSITPVKAIPAEPFCASRVAMDLPRRSEDERRLRSAGSPEDTWITTTLVRPVTRWATKLAVSRSWQSRTILLGGLAAAGLVPLTLAVPGGRLSWLLAAILMVGSALLFLTSAQLVRYRRRPSVSGAFRYRQAHRWADVLIVFGLGLAAGSASPAGWIWAAIAMAAIVVAANATLTTRSVGSAHLRQWWVLRWLVAAVALALAGPLTALTVSVMIALLGTAANVLAHSREGDRSIEPATREQRFLVAPGALLDAGVLVRAISNLKVALPPLHPGLITAAAVGVAVVGVLLSWGQGGWILLFAALAAVAAFAWVLARPARGSAAWALPTVVTATEIAVLVAVAAALPGIAPIAITAIIGAIVLINGVVADRWQLLHRAPQPWLPVADFGFDGRMVLAAATVLLGSSIAGMSLTGLAIWLLLIWAAAFSTGRRQFTANTGPAISAGDDVHDRSAGMRSLKA